MSRAKTWLYDWSFYGKLTIENDELAVYLKCQIGPSQLSVAQTSPLSNNHEVNSITLTARVVLGHLHEQHGRFSLANILF